MSKENVIIVTHGNEQFVAEMDYEPEKIAELLNDMSKQVVAIGDVVISKSSIARIYPERIKMNK